MKNVYQWMMSRDGQLVGTAACAAFGLSQLAYASVTFGLVMIAVAGWNVLSLAARQKRAAEK